MRLHWIATCVAMMLLAGPAIAADQQQKQQAAENKAEVLEQKAAENSSPAPARKAEAITKSEVQAVDPAGAAPLDDAITCLARSIYWEAKGKDSVDMEAVANVVMNRLGHGGSRIRCAVWSSKAPKPGVASFRGGVTGALTRSRKRCLTPSPRKSRARR